MGIYEFKPEDAERFSRDLGMRAVKRGPELVFKECPYCHGGSKNDKNTFAINLRTGLFNCKRSGCNVKGNMLTLARDFSFSLGKDADEYYRMEYASHYIPFKKKHIIPNDPAYEYLCKERGISKEVVEQYQVTSKMTEDGRAILCFTFFDENKQPWFVKYRHTDYDKERDGGKEWCERNRKPILYGMEQCDPNDHHRLVITEGQIDSLSLATAGIKNAVSVPLGMNGYTWIPFCWDFLQSFDELVVFGDCEHGHVTLSDLVNRFNGVGKIVRTEDYHGLKDANDILRKIGPQALIDAVENAEAITAKAIRSMDEIGHIDLDSMTNFPTGIAELDHVLHGGFKAGDLVILSGERGNGKSTFASQIVVNMNDNGIGSMIYSGELSPEMVRMIMDMQASGMEKQDEAMLAKLNDWYRGRMFVYDRSYKDENDHLSVVKAIEQCVKLKGVQFIMIDNLMTAMCTENISGDTLNQQQNLFVSMLKDIAMKYQVVVMLIAHPRKRLPGTGFTNDEVSGASEITNRADIIMSYDRIPPPRAKKGEEPKEVPNNLRALKVSKNRLTGDLTGKEITADGVDVDGILMRYQKGSRRIAGMMDRPKRYSWEGNTTRTANEFEDDIPFLTEDDKQMELEQVLNDET